jgi:hypothetical protein
MHVEPDRIVALAIGTYESGRATCCRSDNNQIAFRCPHLEICATNDCEAPRDTCVSIGTTRATRLKASRSPMPLSSPKLRRFVRHALIGVAGDTAPDRAQLASSFDLLCERLRARLQPLFGATAIAALFARALHVATAEFPWLADVVPTDGERCSVEGLERVSGHIERDALEEGLATVLAHDIGLLSAFIGDDFVMPLVEAAWGATLPAVPGLTEGDHD